jgi:hypothetical protein
VYERFGLKCLSHNRIIHLTSLQLSDSSAPTLRIPQANTKPYFSPCSTPHHLTPFHREAGIRRSSYRTAIRILSSHYHVIYPRCSRSVDLVAYGCLMISSSAPGAPDFLSQVLIRLKLISNYPRLLYLGIIRLSGMHRYRSTGLVSVKFQLRFGLSVDFL